MGILHTHTHTQTDVGIGEYPVKGLFSGFVLVYCFSSLGGERTRSRGSEGFV